MTLKLDTYLLTYTMQKSPSWDANRFSASQEILHILWNPKVRYRSHKWPPPVSITEDTEQEKNYLESHIETSCFFMNATVRCSWLRTRAFLLLIKDQIELQQVFTLSFFLSFFPQHSIIQLSMFSTFLLT